MQQETTQVFRQNTILRHRAVPLRGGPLRFPDADDDVDTPERQESPSTLETRHDYELQTFNERTGF